MKSEENNFHILDKAIEKYTEEINNVNKIIYFYSIIGELHKLTKEEDEEFLGAYKKLRKLLPEREELILWRNGEINITFYGHFQINLNTQASKRRKNFKLFKKRWKLYKPYVRYYKIQKKKNCQCHNFFFNKRRRYFFHLN